MSKRKKYKSERDLLYEKRNKELLDYQRPNGGSNRYAIKTHYMLNHINYVKMDLSAKVILEYMIDWAMGSDEYLKTGVFEFSTTLLARMKVMSNVTSGKALRELEHYGFIRKANNATYQSGMKQRWSFSDEWYRRTYKKYDAK